MRHFPKISKYFKNILTLGRISTGGGPEGGTGGGGGLTSALCDN